MNTSKKNFYYFWNRVFEFTNIFLKTMNKIRLQTFSFTSSIKFNVYYIHMENFS